MLADWSGAQDLLMYSVLAVVGVVAFIELCGLRIIPNDQVGIVENLWSPKGSVTEGRIIALGGEAGYQVDILRGGIHFGLWRWKFRIHKVGLVTVPQGQLAYVYARDGGPVETMDPVRTDQKMTVDSIAIVTVHDGPSLPPGEIIAPDCGNSANDENYHNNYQDPEAFLRSGGRRGRQYTTLTDGTYFINRWFASVELKPKTVVPIGYVGVVVSYIGRPGKDLSGTTFRHGERVAEGERGVWEKALGPSKYPFNTYAGNIIL